MKAIRPTILTVAAAVLMAGGVSFSPVVIPQANAQISVQFGWQTPPQEYSDFARQGFHAGIEAAHHDLAHGRPPDPRRHEDFRHPHVGGHHARDDFRRGFEHGYWMAYQHRGDWGYHDHHPDWDHPHM